MPANISKMVIASSPSKPERAIRPDADEPALPPGGALDEGRLPPEALLNVVEHPIAQHALTMLRNKHTPTKAFRLFSDQLVVLLTLEATRSLPVREETIETPLEKHAGRILGKPVVFLSLTRRGLGLAHRVSDFIPEVVVGSVSLEHTGDAHRLTPRLHLSNAPALGDARVILFDPVVGTGYSASVALHRIRTSGATDISLLSFLITPPGLERVQAAVPGLKVWTTAIERELDLKKGPLPGLGNFSERLYGSNP